MAFPTEIYQITQAFEQAGQGSVFSNPSAPATLQEAQIAYVRITTKVLVHPWAILSAAQNNRQPEFWSSNLLQQVAALCTRVPSKTDVEALLVDEVKEREVLTQAAQDSCRLRKQDVISAIQKLDSNGRQVQRGAQPPASVQDSGSNEAGGPTPRAQRSLRRQSREQQLPAASPVPRSMRQRHHGKHNPNLQRQDKEQDGQDGDQRPDQSQDQPADDELLPDFASSLPPLNSYAHLSDLDFEQDPPITPPYLSTAASRLPPSPAKSYPLIGHRQKNLMDRDAILAAAEANIDQALEHHQSDQEALASCIGLTLDAKMALDEAKALVAATTTASHTATAAVLAAEIDVDEVQELVNRKRSTERSEILATELRAHLSTLEGILAAEREAQQAANCAVEEAAATQSERQKKLNGLEDNQRSLREALGNNEERLEALAKKIRDRI